MLEETFVSFTGRKPHDYNSFIFFGLCTPFLLFPVYLLGTIGAKCVYCICTASMLLLTEAVPAPVLLFFPFIVFIDRDFPEVPAFRTIVNDLLHEISVMLLVLSVESTSLLYRTSMKMLTLFGTRIRNLLCSCMMSSACCSLFMGDTAAVLLVSGLARHMVNTLQDDTIKAFQQRAMFHQATAGLTEFRRRLLTDILWPRRLDERHPGGLSPPQVSPANADPSVRSPHPCSSGGSREEERYQLPQLALSKYADTWVVEYLVDDHLTDDDIMRKDVGTLTSNIEQSSDPRQRIFPPHHTPPKAPASPGKPSLLSSWQRKGKRPRKQTSIIEDGHVVIPGESSPKPKSTPLSKRYTCAKYGVPKKVVSDCLAQMLSKRNKASSTTSLIAQSTVSLRSAVPVLVPVLVL